MRATLGAGLLLASSMLVGVAATPADAASGCEDPDTTWVGPVGGGSASWAEPANWSGGVPTAASVVCIPGGTPGPVVLESTSAAADVIDAADATVTIERALTVGTSFDVATLVSEVGELVGPGTTTVTGGISGSQLTLLGSSVVELGAGVVVASDLTARQGSLVNVRGNALLGDGATIDSLGGRPFTITETGALTLDGADSWAKIEGGFANHGEVSLTDGQWLLMLGASPEDAHPDQHSTGTFTGGPGTLLNVSGTELRDGAHLDGVTVDNVTVPKGDTVTVADSDMLNGHQTDTAPSIHGEGELVLTDGTVVDGPRFGDSLTVTVPAGEVVTMGFSSFLDQARLQVYGEILQEDGLSLENDARLDVYGVHRAVRGTAVESRGEDPGLEIIHPGGQLLADEDAGLIIDSPFVNRGTVDSGSGFFFVAPAVESPASSSGTFRAGTAGTLALGYPFEDGPQFALDQAVVEGEVDVYGRVRANGLQVRGHLSTGPGGATNPPGRLELTGTTTLANGASVAGDVLVGGRLEADLGAMGTATLSGAGVTGRIHVTSGTLEVPSLATTTLLADGTLVGGHWTAEAGATLNLPAITSNDTTLKLMGPGASFGDGLAVLARTGPNGKLKLIDGADLAVPGPFRNEGNVRLSPGSRFDVGGQYLQLATGALIVEAASDGIGRVRAEGRRDLAGAVVVDREPTYTPTVDTLLTFLTSNGRVGPDDEFDDVVSPRFGSRKLRVVYERDRVRLRVDRVG